MSNVCRDRSELVEEFFRIETEYDLFSQQYKGVYFWKLIRFELFEEIESRLGILDKVSVVLPSKNDVRQFYKYLSHLTNEHFKSPLKNHLKLKYLLFSSPRKYKVNGAPMDIYSYDLEKEWLRKGIPYGVVEKSVNGRFMRKSAQNVYWDRYLFPGAILKKIPLAFKKKRSGVFKPLREIRHIAGIPLSDIPLLREEEVELKVKRFMVKKKYYSRVLDHHEPEKVFLVCSYGYEALIAAAQDKGIEVIEIQHGTVTHTHMGYSYPKNVKVPYFPDKFYMWGKFWYDISDLPLKKDQVVFTGFPYVYDELSKYRDLPREDNRVLFISQWSLARKLIPYAIELAEKSPEYDIYYRFHPLEENKWEYLYPELMKGVKSLKNLHVEKVSETPLYSSLAISGTVVGVYSTTIIEAIASGCNIVFIDLPGVEYYDFLIKNNYFRKVSDVPELKASVKAGKTGDIDISYFFSNIHSNPSSSPDSSQ